MIELIAGFLLGFIAAAIMFADYLNKLDKDRARGELFEVDGKAYRAREVKESPDA